MCVCVFAVGGVVVVGVVVVWCCCCGCSWCCCCCFVCVLPVVRVWPTRCPCGRPVGALFVVRVVRVSRACLRIWFGWLIVCVSVCLSGCCCVVWLFVWCVCVGWCLFGCVIARLVVWSLLSAWAFVCVCRVCYVLWRPRLRCACVGWLLVGGRLRVGCWWLPADRWLVTCGSPGGCARAVGRVLVVLWLCDGCMLVCCLLFVSGVLVVRWLRVGC